MVGRAPPLNPGKHLKSDPLLVNSLVPLATARETYGGRIAGRHLAVVTDGSKYSELLSRSARAGMGGSSMTPALEDSIAPSMQDYADLMNDLKAKGIRLLYYTGYNPEAAVIAKELHDRGMGVQLVGSDSLNDEEFLAAADFAADGVMFSAEADSTRFASALPLIAAFQAAGVVPTDYTVRTYAAIRLWADASAKAGSTEAEKVAPLVSFPWLFSCDCF